MDAPENARWRFCHVMDHAVAVVGACLLTCVFLGRVDVSPHFFKGLVVKPVNVV